MTAFTDTVSSTMRRWAPRLLAGALAGFIAAIPMAGVMFGLNRLLTRTRPVLPPKQITARAARRAGAAQLVQPGKAWGPATWLAHLGYGAAAASLYPVVTRRLPVPAVLRGMLFALAVWAAGYMGWLPALNLFPPATEESARRNAAIISSHLVWGSLIGLLTGRLANFPGSIPPGTQEYQI